MWPDRSNDLAHSRIRLVHPLACLTAAVISFLSATETSLAQCAGTWTQRLAPGPTGRTVHAMDYDASRGVTVLFGGTTAPNDFDDNQTWEWNGTIWSQKLPVASPSARNGHALAYDINRRVTVLFGGAAGMLNGETWEWDGTSWTQKSPMPAPSPRFHHAMAYDAGRGVTVLFGGYAGNPIGDTWEWNGTSWSQRSPAAAPSPRYSHAMAYDSARGVTVLFGGDTNMGAVNGETWEWNGTTWTQRVSVTSPSARKGPAMAYDSKRGVTVLFGGDPSGALLALSGETWEWDGSNWSKRIPIPAPSARAYEAMAYDSARSLTVLFGGRESMGGISPETWEWAGPGPYISQQPVDLNVTAGQPAAFSTIAAGAGSPAYQWRRNGNPLTDVGAISGSTTNSLTINPAAVEDAGSYDCVVSSGCGAIASSTATLTVEPTTMGTDDSTGTSAPCGTCGGGAATMMPIMLFSLIMARSASRSRRK